MRIAPADDRSGYGERSAAHFGLVGLDRQVIVKPDHLGLSSLSADIETTRDAIVAEAHAGLPLVPRRQYFGFRPD